MGIGHLLPAENGSGEGCRERVTGSNGVRHRYLGRLLEGNHSRSEHIAAVRSASQDKHLQVILGQQNPAFVLQVDARVAENTADGHQLLIVYLEDVAAAHGFAEYLFGIEPLAEIDVEYLQLPLRIGHRVEKTVDGDAACFTALRQRAETYGTRVQCQTLQFVGKGNVVPGHAFFYLIARHAHGIERHLHRSRGVRHALNLRAQPLPGEHIQNLVPIRIGTYGTDHTAVETKLRCMVSKVCRSTAYLLSFGEAVPQSLAHTYYYLIHNIILFNE